MASEPQKKSLVGRLLSLETLLLLIGLFFLGSGGITGERTQLFWGVMIIIGSVILHLVRKKDWKKHWEEQELMRQYLEEKRKQEQDHDRNA